MRHTENPPRVIMPSPATVRHVARREGLGKLSEDEQDFVWDLLAKASGATVQSFDEIAAQADAAASAFSEASAYIEQHGDGCGHTMEHFEEEYYRHHVHRYAMLEGLDLSEISGYNNVTKAVRAVKLFRRSQQLWILMIVLITDDVLMDRLGVAFEAVERLTPASLKMLEAFVGDSDEPTDDAKQLALELQFTGIQVDEMLRVARQLDEMDDLSNPQRPPTPDPNGEEVVNRDIRELSELGRAAQNTYALPGRLRMKQAAMGELGVREARTRRDKKQLLYIVFDGTGSMLWDDMLGASRAAGVLMNRLNAVMDGSCEVYLRFFDTELHKGEFHANSVESARELLRAVSDPAAYFGGGTRFEAPLRDASVRAQQLLTERGFRDPEMVMVTDGQAPVPELETLGGIILHTVQVGIEENTTLSELARQSGGTGIYAGITMGMD